MLLAVLFKIKKKSELLKIKKKINFGDTNRVKIMWFENEPAVFCFIPPLPCCQMKLCIFTMYLILCSLEKRLCFLTVIPSPKSTSFFSVLIVSHQLVTPENEKFSI